MKFDGTFEIDNVSLEEVWLALSDPYMIKASLPGCQFLVPVEDGGDVDFEQLRTEAENDGEDPPILPDATPEDVAERAFVEGNTYATLIELSVGNVKPSFESTVTITEREFPRMSAAGEGSAANSAFEMSAWMELSEVEDGVAVEWEAEADVFGKIAQLGGRVIKPVANRVVKRFFDQVADRLKEVGDAAEEETQSSLRDRVSGLF
jgi:carbon monoxide dehydrogenase subunit G